MSLAPAQNGNPEAMALALPVLLLAERVMKMNAFAHDFFDHYPERAQMVAAVAVADLDFSLARMCSSARSKIS